MENHDKTGSKVHGFVLLEKHAGNDTVYGMEETVKEGTVIKEKIPELFINCKNTVAVMDINQLKGHSDSTFHGIFIAAGGAEPAMAPERDKFEPAAVWAAIHGTAKRRITTVNHSIDIFHLSFSGMKGIFHFFIMIFKDFL